MPAWWSPPTYLPGPYLATGLPQDQFDKSLLGQCSPFSVCCKSVVAAQIYLAGALIKIPCQLRSWECMEGKQRFSSFVLAYPTLDAVRPDPSCKGFQPPAGSPQHGARRGKLQHHGPLRGAGTLCPAGLLSFPHCQRSLCWGEEGRQQRKWKNVLTFHW